MLDVAGSDSLYWRTALDNSGLLRGTSQAKGILRGFMSNVTKMDILAGIGISAGIAFGLAAKKAYTFSKEFEMRMKEVQTISKATQENFDGISDSVINLSKIVPQTALELSEAFYQIVSAGYDGAAGLELLEVSAKAAVAGVTDTKTAADGLTTVLNAFHMSASEAEHVADVLFKTVERGKTTFPELADNIATVAPIAASSGVAFEQVAAALMTITKQGVPTTVAVTQLRRAIIAMNKILGDGWQKAMSLQEGMNKIREMAGGSQVALQDLVQDIRGVNAVLEMTGVNSKTAAEDLEAAGKAAGAMGDAFTTMKDTTTNQLKILANNVVALLKPIGDGISAVIKEIAEAFNNVVFGVGEEAQIKKQLEMFEFKSKKLELYSKRMIELERKINEEQKKGDTERLEELKDQMKRVTALYLKWVDTQVEIINSKVDLKPEKTETKTVIPLTPEEQIKAIQEQVKTLEDGYGKYLKFHEAISYLPAEIAAGITEQMVKPKDFIDTLNDLKDKAEALGKEGAETAAVIIQMIAEVQMKAAEDIKKSLDEIRKAKEKEEKEAEALKKIIEKSIKDIGDKDKERVKEEILAAKRRRDNIKDIISGVVAISGALYGMNKDLDEALSLFGDIAQIAVGIQTGGIGGIFNAVATGIKTISGIYSKLKNDTNEILEAHARFLLTQRRVIHTLSDKESRERIEEIMNSFLNYDILIRQAQDAADAAMYAYIQALKEHRPVQEVYLLVQDMLAAQEHVDQIKNSLLGIAQEFLDVVIGLTPTTIADSITQGLQESIDSAKMFSDTFNELMQQAIIGAFKASIASNYLKTFYDEFAKAIPGGITGLEVSNLRSIFGAATSQIQADWNALQSVLSGVGFELPGTETGEEAAKPLTGAFQGMEQQTASLLAAQFNAMRIDIKMASDHLERIVLINTGILSNTNYNRYLKSIDAKLTTTSSGVSIADIFGGIGIIETY